MSRNYKFHNSEGLYFVSFAVVGWRIETKLGPVIDYIVEDIMIKETVTEIIEGL